MIENIPEVTMMFFTIYPRIPFTMNIVVGPVISYVAILMNITIFIVLSEKDIKTPSTVIMQGLAISDSFTALCTYGLEPLFMFFYKEIGRSELDNTIEVWWSDGNHTVDETRLLIDMEYPVCVIHYCMSQLSDSFHLVSVLLTSFLGLQKLLVVAFPLWSQTKITIKQSIIVCLVCFLFAMVINIPRMFVVSLGSVNGTTCYISKPYEILEEYVLTFYPILCATMLVCAAVTMFISTCFIIFTLCNRKHVRRHASASAYEKKSCALILCVLIVFLLSEIPRLYINSNLFNTYRFDLGEEDIAWSKVETKVSQQSLVCYKDAEGHVVHLLDTQTNLTKNISCDTNSSLVPQPIVDEELVSKWIDKFLIYRYITFEEKMKLRIKENYGGLVDHIVQKLSALVKYNLKQDMTRMVKCYNKTDNIDKIMTYLLNGYFECDNFLLDTLTENFPFLILGSSPYSEPMNYILNIIWGSIDFTLAELKLFMEMMKFCTVIGCASNFVIYIVMSGKLRAALHKALSKKLSVMSVVKTGKETEEQELT